MLLTPWPARSGLQTCEKTPFCPLSTGLWAFVLAPEQTNIGAMEKQSHGWRMRQSGTHRFLRNLIRATAIISPL